MAIWGSDNDGKVKFLEEERVKLWTQLRALEGESRTLKEETRSLKEESLTLKDAVNKKTSDYEAEAKNAAKKAVEYKNKSVTAKETITQNLNQSNGFLADIITAHDSVIAFNSQILDIVDSSKTNHNNVVAASEDIQARKETIEKQITELEELFNNHNTYINNIKVLETLATNGQELSTKIDALHKSILTKKNEIDELYYQIIGYSEKDPDTGEETEVQGLKDQLEESYEELKTNLTKTKEDLSEHMRKQIADSISFASQKEGQFNNTFKRYDEEYIKTIKKIDDLLPKALTAGLSYAYSEKKLEEITESKSLSFKFIIAIICMVAVSLIPFIVSIYSWVLETPLDKVLMDMPRLVLAILPLYIPVLWLAYSANKSLKLSKRLIEEYTHKEVLSKTFEGLSKQIENIEDKDISSDLRIKLLYNILEVSSENPGKLITDYNKSDHPLMDALDKSVKLGNAVNKLVEIPGLAKLATYLDKKAKRILEENKEKADDGLDVLSGSKKTKEKEKAKDEDEEKEEEE